MSSVGSFGTFTTARLGIYVSQKGLSVTGNNIANINTTGYTRQRLDQVSFKTGGNDLYQSSYDMRVGNGAYAKSVSQLRDPYLDIRFRAENASVGFHNGRLDGLNDIATILDEIGKGEKDGDGLLYAEFSKFADALRHLQTESGDEVNDTLVANSAKALTELFHSAATRLERLHTNTETQMRQEVDDINSILINIRNLNESIRTADLYGDKALELRDERNNLIDELSEKLKIDASYSMVDVGLGKQVEKLTIRLGNANPDKGVYSDSCILVDGNYCAQLTTPKDNAQFDEEYEVFDKTSQAYKDAVKAFRKSETVTVGGKEYKTLEELDAAIDNALADPATELKPFRYLDENGLGTNDPREAKQEFDSNYNITVSDLRDKNGKEWIDYEHTRTAPLSAAQTQGFPTRARYTGSFTMDGQWKTGDKIKVSVGGTDYEVEIGKQLTAKQANEDPKNVSNAIRDVLVASPAFRGGDADGPALYNINTTTSKNSDGSYNVLLSIFKKEAGKVDNPPSINISATSGAGGNEDYNATKGSVTLGAMTDQNAADGKPKSWTATVEPGKSWNVGDVIEIKSGANVVARAVVGQDISAKSAANPKTLATTLARKFKLDGFTVSASSDKDGNAKLTFTATDTETTDPPALTATVTAPKNASVTMNGNSKWNDNGDGSAGTDGSFGSAPNPKVQDNGDNTISTEARTYYQDDNDNWYRASMIAHTSKTKMLDDNDLYGKLQAVRELLTEEGEFSSQKDIAEVDESAAIKRGIPYYRHTLDLLARQFANTMNEANTGCAVDQNGNYLDKEGQILTDASGNPINKETGFTSAQTGEAVKKFIADHDVKGVNARGNLTDSSGKEILLGDRPVSATSLTAEELGITGSVADYLNGATIDSNGNVFKGGKQVTLPGGGQLTINGFTASQKKKVEDSYLESNGGWMMGGNLFSNQGDTDDASGITAANISVAASWSDGNVHVVPTYIKLFGGDVSNTTQNLNALHMGNLVDRKLVYDPQDLLDDALSDHLFEGSFQELLEKMSTTLGNDQRTTKVSLETHVGQALDIDTTRDSVSAVDLNDEAMDLMQYTHSLNAAYRLMTTLDEMLERLITGTGVTR